MLSPVSLDGRRCPCVEGWVCDESRDLCVLGDAPDEPDGGLEGSDAGPAQLAANVGDVVAWDDGSAELIVASGEVWTVDPDAGKIVATSADGATRTIRAAGEGTLEGIRYVQVASGRDDVGEYGVLAVGALRVESGGTLLGERGAARALVIVSAADVVIDGIVRVAAGRDGPGPGGGAGGMRDGTRGEGDGGGGAGGGGGREGWSGHDGGGGGGGLGSAGGSGGDGSGARGGGGGAPRCEETLVPLCAGSGGGAGADNDGGRGGHGGGAIQISSATLVEVRGAIDASGEGGVGGRASVGRTDAGGGGGGGSGGAILLEAPRVRVSGELSALGGAGGQGARCEACDGSGLSGESHAPGDPVPAPGSESDQDGGGGGAGSDATGLAEDGRDEHNAGGGGGGAGRIRILAYPGAVELGEAAIFPSPESGLATVGELEAPLR